ncbi:hypothetical protein AVEN_105540-1 [Araneus ventricosus]|uniref:Uncharacterized protein n=1 Tax=Araneus ventricosus TaxID=182803 RepID=A0A4Y2GPF7_ARAVE|nr:hypothetical protein AVEN_105540-1 [Araneus ventricosus]
MKRQILLSDEIIWACMGHPIASKPQDFYMGMKIQDVEIHISTKTVCWPNESRIPSTSTAAKKGILQRGEGMNSSLQTQVKQSWEKFGVAFLRKS